MSCSFPCRALTTLPCSRVTTPFAFSARNGQKPSPSDATALKPVDAALLARGGDIKSAPNLYLNAVELGAKKAAGKPRDIAILAVISGFHIGFGGWMAITIGGALPGIKVRLCHITRRRMYDLNHPLRSHTSLQCYRSTFGRFLSRYQNIDARRGCGKAVAISAIE